MKKNLWKCIFRASRRVRVFHIFSQIMGGGVLPPNTF